MFLKAYEYHYRSNKGESLRIIFAKNSSILLMILLFLILKQPLNAQISDQDVLRAIKNDQFETLKRFLKKGNDPNRLYGKSKVPLLHYAASINKVYPVKVLLDAGADIELLFENNSPLMIAVRYNNEQVIKELLKRGALVDAKNSEGETAFILAAKKNFSSLLVLLKESGASQSIEDKKGSQAIDHAYEMQNIQAYNYLKTLTDSKYDNLVLPNYFDGPYAIGGGKYKFELNFLRNNSIDNKTSINKVNIDIKKEEYVVDNNNLPFKLRLSKSTNKNPSKYSQVEKVLAIGDLHGGFDDLKKLLISNKITDSNLNWIWGKGHVVFVGDVFDRGDKVTECFWLIYKLEKEALKSGGNVHLVLGNHEIMQLTGDKRYLAKKYIHLCNRLNFDYTELYNENSILGKWIRSKNTILTINNILFVHGGISDELMKKSLSIDYINDVVKDILTRKNWEPQTEIEDLILGANGPLWYRGFLKMSDSYYKSTGGKFDFNEGKLDKILQFYNVKTIVFANTNVSAIKPLYNFTMFGIDIPFSEPGIELQGLLWENGHFSSISENGVKRIIY